MRSLFFVFALCAAFVGTTVEGWAGAYGSSIMNTSNLRLEYFNGLNWVNATNSEVSIISTTITSRSNARLGATNMTSPLANGFNASQRFVSPTMLTPAEQNSALAGLGSSLTNSFAYGDTWGDNSATLISGISSSTLAEVNALPPLAGSAFGNVGGTSLFEVQVAQGGQYRLAFDANLAMRSEDAGYANNSFRVQVNQSSSGGGSVSIDYSDAALNRSITGNNLVNVSTSFFSPVITLEDYETGASTATFTITQASTAGVSVVPEPSSIAIFGLMSVGSLAALRRRRAGERKPAEA
jgi:hypothetical protein